MQNRFHPGVLLNLDTETLPAHARRGLGRVVHVNSVHTQPRQQLRALNLSRTIDAPRRHELHQLDELSLGEKRTQPRALRKGRRGVSLLTSGAAPVTVTWVCSSMARMAERMARM
jgi:hypothetical protein